MSQRAGASELPGQGVGAVRLARARRANPVAERALRAAGSAGRGAADRPRVRWSFLGWLVGRLLALVVLVGAAWVLYDSASSDRFNAQSVRVTGNVLLRQTEVESVAALNGANVFWIDRHAVEARLMALPVVERAEVTPVLPERVDVRIVERQPVGFWVSGNQTYLVDREGVVLKAIEGGPQSPRACAGQPCNPRAAASFPVVTQADGQPIAPGSRVRPETLTASTRLSTLLPQAGVRPLQYEWSADSGLEVRTDQGWRVRFDDRGSLERQVTSLQAIRDQLAKSKGSAELIDVRFEDRPYFR